MITYFLTILFDLVQISNLFCYDFPSGGTRSPQLVLRAFHDLRIIISSTALCQAARRVPGLPIRDCAASSNNLVPRGAKVSAIDVTVKTILHESLYLVSGLSPIYAPSQLSLCTHTPTAHSPAISRFPWNFFFSSDPSIFLSARFAKSSGQVPVPSLPDSGKGD